MEKGRTHTIKLDSRQATNGTYAIEAQGLNVYYDDFRALKNVDLKIERHKVTAIIGPSGCGKSTMLRAFNRMNELFRSARTEGRVLFNGLDIYHDQIDPVEVRRHIGMVFQKPNPFPKSIYENVAWVRASTATVATWTTWSTRPSHRPRYGTR